MDKPRRLCERYLDQMGPSGYVSQDRVLDRRDGETVRSIWLRRIGDQVQVLAEMQEPNGSWRFRLVIREHADGSFSHIVEPEGMRTAPPDPISEGSSR